MNSHVGVEGGTAVERFAAGLADVRFLRRMNDFVPTESAGLPESFAANLQTIERYLEKC